MSLDFAPEPLVFFVPGVPAPGGSKRYVGKSRKTGRAILIDAGGKRNKCWRRAVAACASCIAPRPLLSGPLQVDFAFTMPRPAHHFYTTKARAGELKDDAPPDHIIPPDVLKLARSTEDALTGVVWDDDAQTTILSASKTYGAKPGCKITITQL